MREIEAVLHFVSCDFLFRLTLNYHAVYTGYLMVIDDYEFPFGRNMQRSVLWKTDRQAV